MDMKGSINLSKDLYSQLAGLGELEIATLVDALREERNRRRELRSMEAKMSLRVGMKVRIKPEHENGKTVGKTFIIDKINPKNLRCTEVLPKGLQGTNTRRTIWTITATLVEPVKN